MEEGAIHDASVSPNLWLLNLQSAFYRQEIQVLEWQERSFTCTVASNLIKKYDLELVYGNTIPDNLISIAIPGLVHASRDMHLGGLRPDACYFGPDQDLGLHALHLRQLTVVKVTGHAGEEPQHRGVLVANFARRRNIHSELLRLLVELVIGYILWEEAHRKVVILEKFGQWFLHLP